MKTLLIAVSMTLVSAGAQTVDFNLDSLAAKAKDKAEVTLEGPQLAQAMQALPDPVKSKMGAITRLVVRHYEFEKPGEYADSDLDSVRKTASASAGWNRIINITDANEHVEIYMLSQDGKTSGFLLIAGEPKELTVVQVAGAVDLASLQEVVKSSIHYDLKSVGGQ